MLKRHRTASIAAITIVSATAIVGCGGSDAGSGPKSAVETFVSALKDDDFEAACAQLSEAGVDDLRTTFEAALLSAQFNGGQDPTNAECPDVVKVAQREASASNTLPTGDMKVTDVDTGSDKAVVKTADGDWTLEEVSGSWRIAKTPLRST